MNILIFEIYKLSKLFIILILSQLLMNAKNQKKAAKPRKKKLTTLGKAVFIVAKLGNSYNTFQHFYYRPPAENRLVDIFNFDPR